MSREAFEANLNRFGATGATVIEGDAFEILESTQLERLKVGVFFWDADHTTRASSADCETSSRAWRLAQY